MYSYPILSLTISINQSKIERTLSEDPPRYSRVFRLLELHNLSALDINKCIDYLKAPLLLFLYALSIINILLYVGFISYGFDDFIKNIMKSLSVMALLI